MINDPELLKILVIVLTTVATTLGGTIVALIVWAAKLVVSAISQLREDMKNFDRRVTRLEAKAHWRLHHKVEDDAA